MPSEEYEIRKVTDAQTLRALAHPVRIALIEALTLRGAMTATEVGELIGESPTTCSFHLRQLAKYGFVEEAGGGKGRARPWRITSIGMSVTTTHDPEAEIAGDALLRVFRERSFAKYQTWLETKGTYPKEWRDAASNSEYMFWATADELEQLNEALTAVMMERFRFQDRHTDPAMRPPGAVPVETLLISYPIELPKPPEDT
jgi:predicted ArsR family transcriptional regulator